MSSARRRQELAKRALRERELAVEELMCFELAPRRRWVLAMSDHALRRCQDRRITSSEIFAALWLGSSMAVRGRRDEYRASYLYNDVVVISTLPIDQPGLPADQWADEFVRVPHPLADARRERWFSEGPFNLHSVITVYRKESS